MELRLSCINPSIFTFDEWCHSWYMAKGMWYLTITSGLRVRKKCKNNGTEEMFIVTRTPTGPLTSFRRWSTNQPGMTLRPWDLLSTHWPLGDLNEISHISNFKANLVIDRWDISYEIALRWMSSAAPYWRLVNIGSGNGLLPSGNRPLPHEPMLTTFYVGIWQHWATMSWQL